jgi:hypothetical protein
MGAAFLDGPISAEYRPVMEMSKVGNGDSCDCSGSCFFDVYIPVGIPGKKRKPTQKPKPKPKPTPKPPKKKAQQLSGWSIPPPLGQAPELRVQ